MSQLTHQVIRLTERGLLPDCAIRAGIRRLLRSRLARLRGEEADHAAEETARFIAEMDVAPIAPLAGKANEQHYEVPPEFFAQVLGPNRKYSACFWTPQTRDLGDAEIQSLAMTCARAQLADGQQILELGCGWGSLSLFMARRYPRAQITAVSNSTAQRLFIEGEARRLQLANLRVVTCDMNDFDADRRFDRIVSVEMFEHMRNYRRLFASVQRWLQADGRFFLHIFVHRSVPYAFVDEGADDWMSRHFFSGGMMPSAALPLHFQDRLRLLRQWSWNGSHYAKTAEAWLANLDERRAQVIPILVRTYGESAAEIWLQRWRVFFMACAELWQFRQGREWFVCHYLFEPAEGI